MINRLLRLIEGVVFIAIFAVLGFGSLKLTNLNNVSKSSWNLPTLTQTPLIQPLILPGGEQRFDSSVGSGWNSEEIPPHLRPMVQTYGMTTIPTPQPQQGVRIQIPDLAIDAPIFQGDEPEQLKKGVGQHLGTADPGEVGNMVLSGHNDKYGEVFRYLDRLEPGDIVIIYTYIRSFTYIVEEWTLVEPDQVEVMAPTEYESVTLISCYPYMIDNLRIIVKARLQKD